MNEAISRKTVSFTRKDQCTREDYLFLDEMYKNVRSPVADNVLGMLEQLKGPYLGYKIDRYEHSLQSATRAYRDGADEETIVCALLHDIGDPLAPDNHSQVAAAILRPFVSEKNYWVIQHHGVFQTYYYNHHYGKDRNFRDRFRDSPHYDACVYFCEHYDQRSFDPEYDWLPLEFFEPMVRRLFAGKPNSFD